MKKVVIYPGRFQPMLAHHAEVFRQLQAQFPDAEVYIGTSDKTEQPNSPFNFKEKQLIAQGLGIDPKRVLLAPRPYHHEDYAQYFDADSTVIIFAVGEKDVERFPFSNVDPKTGLDMTVRGEPRPTYYQKINTYNASPLPMKQRGYITVVPNVMAGDQTASASAFRDALVKAPDKEAAKEVFTKQFGQMNNQVFDLIYNKVTGSHMNEQINQIRKLAGLPPLAESAPVEFESQVDPKNAQFTEPTKASMKYSIANRFPKGTDLSNPAVKKDQFLNALLRSPEALLGEISERLDPTDDASLDIGAKIDDIQAKLMKSAGKLANLSKEDKEFVLELAGVAVDRMSLVAGDTAPAYDPEAEPELESVNLDVIRENYGVMEGSAGAVYDALRRRVLAQHLDLLTDYGIEAVLNAIKDVSSRFDYKDLEEIGSSDVSAWMGWVKDNLAAGEYGPKREPKPVKLGPPEHWDSSRVGEPLPAFSGNVQYYTRLGDIEEGADDVLADEFEDNRVRTIYNQDGVEITSTTDPEDDDGSYIEVHVDGELVATGDYDLYSGFWFSLKNTDGSPATGTAGSVNFSTPEEIAQFFAPMGDDELEEVGTVNEARKVPANYGALMARKKRQAQKKDKAEPSKKDAKLSEGPIGKVIADKKVADKKAAYDKEQQEQDDAAWDLADRMFASSAKRKTPGRTPHERALLGDSKIAEVSDDTLRSYRVKAKKDANDNYNNARDTSMYSKEPDKGKKAFAMMKQSKKRQAGVKKASDRLGVSIYDESLREGEDSAKLTASQRKQLQKITKGQSLNLYAWATKVLDKGAISSAEAKKLANLVPAKSKVTESVQPKESVGSIIKRVFGDKLTWEPGFSKLYGDSRTTKKEKVTDYKMKSIRVDGNDAERRGLATALQAELSAAGYNVIGNVSVYDDVVAFQVRTPHSNGLTEGTMAQGIFDRNAKRAKIALAGLDNVLRDALPAGQAADILYRYVFDDELFDLIDDLADRKHDADIRANKAIMAQIKYLRDEANSDLQETDLQENPLIGLAVGGAARAVAGRMGASALGQAVASTATSTAVNKALDKETPVDEDDDADLDFDFDLGPVPADKDAEAKNPNIKFIDIDEDEEYDPELAAEIRQLVQDIVNDQVDLYTVYANPEGPAQQALHPTLAKYYDTIASTHRLHPDDDFEQILDGVADWLMNDFLSGEYDVDSVNESDLNESEWSEIWYKGKRVGYVNDEHEYTTRSQRANSDFELDDLEPAQISRILKKLGVNPVSEAVRPKKAEYHEYNQFVKACKSMYPNVKFKKQDELKGGGLRAFVDGQKVGDWDGSGLGKRPAPGLLNVKADSTNEGNVMEQAIAELRKLAGL